MANPAATITNVCEFEEVAKQKLPKMVYDYYASGAEDQWTLKENRHAFERIRSEFSYSPRALDFSYARALSLRSLAIPIMKSQFQRPRQPVQPS